MKRIVQKSPDGRILSITEETEVIEYEDAPTWLFPVGGAVLLLLPGVLYVVFLALGW